MRFVLAGIITFLLYSAAFAGVLGKVDSIGFEANIRADCWVPLLVQVTSDGTGPEDYQLQVVQYDEDGDEVVYARPVLVNPGTQNFWTYFKPESINDGLPSTASGTSQDLAKRLRIYLATPDGSKRIAQVSVAGRMPSILDDSDQDRGDKLILCVGRRPNVTEFDPGAARVFGLPENISFATADLRRLPDNVLGYDAVDAVVWTDADVDKLDASQFRALRQYVRNGGRLVVLQNPEMARAERFNDLLPVRVLRVETWNSNEPLQSILHPIDDLRLPLDPRDEFGNRRLDPFKNARGPYRLAHAEANPQSLIAAWIDWPDGTRTPYIARGVYGTGMVAWVAQDITDPSIRDVAWGWPNFWGRVFDWPAYSRLSTQGRFSTYDLAILARNEDHTKNLKDTWAGTGVRDVGYSYTERLDLDSKTAALVSVAFLFFITYWVVAGPGAYLVLAARKRSHYSWFIFGATAVVATVLTVLIAQLVLRGGPQIKHVSLVRAASGGNDPAVVQSRFGIYLPQDRPDTQVALNGRDPNGPAVITPRSVDPRYISSKSANVRDSRYTVPISNDDAGERVVTEVPFRSTLKKLQATWTGAPLGRVSGNAQLTNADRPLAGIVSNNTGRDLSHVLFVFSAPNKAEQGDSRPFRDYVLYLRGWPNGQTLDLAKVAAGATTDLNKDDFALTLDGDKGRFGFLDNAATYFYRGMRSSGYGMVGETARWDVGKDGYRQSFPIVSLYDRLPAMRNLGNTMNRVDVVRRGVHGWDLSGAVAGGGLVVLAQSANDVVPLPLTVEGDVPEGNGVTFWQFVLPLDRSQVNASPPTTLPAPESSN